MIHACREPLRLLLLFVATFGLAACAGGIPEVEPVDIPRLEQEIAADPLKTDLQVQLGMAQFKDRNFEAARSTLQAAREAGDESGPLYLYLGMTQEELQDWNAARAAYNTYLEVGASAPAREEVRKRLTMIGRNLLRAQAQQALAQEAEIAATSSVVPQSVAVLPMGFNSDRVELEPLIYALSDMMITDFKVSNALVVLERAQIQTLLDEMALTSGGYSEAGTGARAGRMLRAEHVFQGVLTTLGEDDLQTDADVLNVPTTSSAGTLSESAVLERLFDMEKQIVIRTIREVLGVELTPAEEQRILDNRMDNVLAFLAYGRGLRELDNGNYAAAQAEFDAALALDPNAFGGNVTIASELSSLIDAGGLTTDQLGTIAGATGETDGGVLAPPSATTTLDLGTIGIGGEAPVGAASTPDGTTADNSGSTFGTLTNVAEGVDPTPTAPTLGLSSGEQSQNPTPVEAQPADRKPVQEVQGRDTVTGTTAAQIRIVIRRPGGEE
jgi:tetratricopeptide (TPR) repeat protein